MEKAQYIVKKRMRVEGIGGRVNLPYGTRLEAVDGLILYNGAAVCATTSRNAHLYLARNDDGRGLEPGRSDHGHHQAAGKAGQGLSRPLGSGVGGRNQPEIQAPGP